MLNQPWRGLDPCCRIYHVQIFISFRTSGSIQIAKHKLEAAPLNPGPCCAAVAGPVAVLLWSQPRLGHNLSSLAWRSQAQWRIPFRHFRGRISWSLENLHCLLCAAAVHAGRAFFNSHSVTDKIIDFSKEPAALVRDDGYTVLGCGRDI